MRNYFLFYEKFGPMSLNCQRCGRCCREIGIAWSELETELVANYLNMDLNDFLDSCGYIINEYSGEIEHPEPGVTPCPFLKYNKDKAICKIYPVRPWICKGYPGPGTSCQAGLKNLNENIE